jgi:hypothetical protein
MTDYKIAKRKRKYNIGNVTQSEDICHNNDVNTQLMSWNVTVQKGWDDKSKTGTVAADYNLPEEHVFTTWLWETDPLEPCPIKTLLNASQLTGLIFARHYAATHPEFQDSNFNIADFLGESSTNNERMAIFQTPVNQLNLRELRDTIQNIQLQWVELGAVKFKHIKDVLHACIHRFGVLASTSFNLDVMNDQGSIEDTIEGGKCVRLNKICIRRFVNVFFILFRHVQLHLKAIRVQAAPCNTDLTIGIHQILAASDDFGIIAMNWDLMPAAKLNYIHDFPGMYNSISQVIYFHNPKYERRMQLRKQLDKYATGDVEAVQFLPCLMQLFPEIPIVYEEENSSIDKTFSWVLAGHTVYLRTPKRELYYHENLITLLSVYLTYKP